MAKIAENAGMTSYAVRKLEGGADVEPGEAMRYLLAIDGPLQGYCWLANHVRSLVEAESDRLDATRVDDEVGYLRAAARVTRLINLRAAVIGRPSGTTPVGYWRSAREPELPDPRDFVDPDWAPDERATVIAYLESGTITARYLGLSPCRICGVPNGCDELTDGTYHWPGGLSHYLEAHDVRLPSDVTAHMLHRAKETLQLLRRADVPPVRAGVTRTPGDPAPPSGDPPDRPGRSLDPWDRRPPRRTAPARGANR